MSRSRVCSGVEVETLVALRERGEGWRGERTMDGLRAELLASSPTLGSTTSCSFVVTQEWWLGCEIELILNVASSLEAASGAVRFGVSQLRTAARHFSKTSATSCQVVVVKDGRLSLGCRSHEIQ